MSFYTDVRAELIALPNTQPQTMRAELIGTVYAIGSIGMSNRRRALILRTDRAGVLRRALKQLKTLFRVESRIEITKNSRLYKHNSYALWAVSPQIEAFIESLDWLGGFDPDKLGLNTAEQQYAMLRGAFLGCGWLNDPGKAYHLEIVVNSQDFSRGLCDMLQQVGLSAKVTQRKESSVVYLKEAESIVEAMAMMGAQNALLRFENVRVLKDVRNSVNRAMNCEAANLTKTLDASFEQVESIRYIQDTVGLDALPPSLYEVAEARLNHPEASLRELTELLAPLGRSGVNHRLRRILEYAQNLRLERGFEQ